MKLREILLVDDSRGTNSLNKRLLQEMKIVEHISVALDGQLALDYLMTSNEKGEYPNPDLIFLDINMPVMDGYQFLEEYNKLDHEMRTNNIVVMLTTSINEMDINKSKMFPNVKGYQFKPLTKEKVTEIITEIFR